MVVTHIWRLSRRTRPGSKLLIVGMSLSFPWNLFFIPFISFQNLVSCGVRVRLLTYGFKKR